MLLILIVYNLLHMKRTIQAQAFLCSLPPVGDTLSLFLYPAVNNAKICIQFSAQGSLLETSTQDFYWAVPEVLFA